MCRNTYRVKIAASSSIDLSFVEQTFMHATAAAFQAGVLHDVLFFLNASVPCAS